MNRRRSAWLGIFVVLGLVAVLVAARFSNTGVVGQQSRAAFPAPPAPGSCLTFGDQSATMVSCGQPHNAEVTQAWAAGETLAGATDFDRLRRLPCGDINAPCGRATTARLSPRNGGPAVWSPVEAVLVGRLIAAPEGQRTSTEGWSACILGPASRAMYRGTLEDLLAEGTSERCLDADSDRPVACTQRHYIELMGVLNPFAFDAHGVPELPLDPQRLYQSCKVLIEAMIGTSEPTFGGALQINARSGDTPQSFEATSTDPNGQPIHAFVPIPFCSVALTGTGSLTRSVIGLGDNALPLA